MARYSGSLFAVRLLGESPKETRQGQLCTRLYNVEQVPGASVISAIQQNHQACLSLGEIAQPRLRPRHTAVMPVINRLTRPGVLNNDDAQTVFGHREFFG